MSGLPCRLTSEDPAGSAPRADAWWLLHVPGPWGPRVVDDLISPDRTGPRVRALAVRRVGRHPAHEGSRVVEAWFAAVGRPVCRWVSGPSDDILADLRDLQDLAEPPTERLAPDPLAPTLLVCTNGRRDLCCGTAGREVAISVADQPGVWECSHLGGHRFAPTALVLPSGWCLGGLTPQAARAALDGARPRLDPATLRGRTDQPIIAQVAEIAVRRHLGLRYLDDVTAAVVVEHSQTWASVVLRTREHGEFRLSLVLGETPPRPASCGADPTVERIWSVSRVVSAGRLSDPRTVRE